LEDGSLVLVRARYAARDVVFSDADHGQPDPVGERHACARIDVGSNGTGSHRGCAVAASLAIHVAISFLLQKQPLLAAGLLTASVTALTGLCIATGAVAPPRAGRGIPSPILGAVLTFLLASGITVIRVAGLGGGDGAGAGGGGADGVAAKDVSFPFSGEYWIFRVPFLRPPEGSLQREGSPFDLSFSTTDHARLYLQARQPLEEPVSMDCCRALRVRYRAQEVHPGAITLGVRLSRSTHFLPDPMNSSGVYLSTLVIENGEHALEFPFPGQSRIPDFREVQLRFDDRGWMIRNPKIQILGFTFLSR
jgi:hypothetical protein